jgi:2-hydroxychromene-2-carboxylate isomerase
VKTTPLTVEVLSLPGCPNVEETLLMAGEVVLAVVPGTEVRDVRLTEAEALERGFPGSPTILVDGQDIEGRGAHAAGVA